MLLHDSIYLKSNFCGDKKSAYGCIQVEENWLERGTGKLSGMMKMVYVILDSGYTGVKPQKVVKTYQTKLSKTCAFCCTLISSQFFKL